MAEKIFGITIGKKKVATQANPQDRDIKAEIEATKRFIPSTPSANIIPPYVIEGYRVDSLKGNFTKAVIGFVILLALLFAGKTFLDMQAAQQINALEEQEQTLQTEARALAPFQAYVTSVDDKRQALYTQFANDVNFARVASSIRAAAEQSGVQVNSIQFTLAATGGVAECPSPDPFNPQSGIGCATLEVATASNAEIIAFTEALEGTGSGFLNPYFPTSNNTENGITYSGSVAFTNEFNNDRYIAMAQPIADQVQALSQTETTAEGDAPTGEEAPADVEAPANDPATETEETE